MKTTKQQINNIIGQLNGINAMIGSGQDCLKVLTQLKAAKAGINAVILRFLEENTDLCLDRHRRGKTKDNLREILNELVKNIN